MLLGYFGEEYNTDTFWDKAEELPGGFIIQREIKKAVKGANFFYNDGITGKPVRCDGLNMDEFNFYFQLWDDFHFLQLLPHGRGSASERRWVIDFIKMFEKIHIETNNFLSDKAQRKSEIMNEMRAKRG